MGSFELQADTGEINKDNVKDVAYAAEDGPPSAFNNSDGDDEGLTNGDDEGETKQASVT